MSTVFFQGNSLQRATASTCGSTTSYDHTNEAWSPNWGIHAPIQMRIDGTLCDEGTYDPHAAMWIGVEQYKDDGLIAQAGFIHEYVDGLAVYCRFWANDYGLPVHAYDCGDDSNDTYVYFQVTTYDAGPSGNYMEIEDCGTGGGYGSCTDLNDDMPEIADHVVTMADGESTNGNSDCNVELMGSSSNETNYGTSSYPIHIQTSEGGTYTGQVPSYDNDANCDHYHQNPANTTFDVWDGRN